MLDMKNLVIFLIFMLISVALYSNPLICPNPPLIGEIYFDDNDDWFIEFRTCNFNNSLDSFDGISIESSNGIAEIKSGIQFTDSTVLITNDSLITSLQINSAGDYIKIVAPFGVDLLAYQDSPWVLDSELSYYFGDYPQSYVSCLLEGQSFCISENPYEVSYLTKSDSTTLGYANTSVEYYGDLVINLKDDNNDPITNVKCYLKQVAYNYVGLDYYEEEGSSVSVVNEMSKLTNSEGVVDFSEFNTYAMNCILTFKTFDGNYLYDTTIVVSVEPNVDNVYDIVLDCDVIWVQNETQIMDDYSFDIFPNPTKDKITLTFSQQEIKINRAAVVKVFSENGDLIKIIPIDKSDIGILDLTFSTEGFSAGNYYCNLDVDGKKVANSKFVVIK